jgi:hypothetical protein
MNEHFTRPRKTNSPTGRKGQKTKPQNRFSSMLMELEQRMAFDAAGAATAEHVQKDHHHGGDKGGDKTGDNGGDRHAADRHGHDSEALSKASSSTARFPTIRRCSKACRRM